MGTDNLEDFDNFLEAKEKGLKAEDGTEIYPLMASGASYRKRIRDEIRKGIEETFPVEGSKYRLEIDETNVEPNTFSKKDQKQAKLEGKSLTEPIKGRVKMVDKDSGEVKDESYRTLAHMPYFTENHTFLVKGNEYSVDNQVRVKPGVYTRKRQNDMLEANFNLGKGRNFRVQMDPESGVFNMQYGSSKIPLYSILKEMGMSDKEIEKKWGKEVAEVNRNKSSGKMGKHLDKLYRKMVPDWEKVDGATKEQKKDLIKEVLRETEMNPKVNKKTLGMEADQVTPDSLLRSSEKLLNVYNDREETDDRDSIEFKELRTPDMHMREKIEKSARPNLYRKVKRKLNQKTHEPKVGKVLPTTPFSESLEKFVTTSSLSNTPMEINPVELIDKATKVTSMGEGGISSTLAVPDQARDVHHSHLGVVDPVRTPENQKAGVNIRSTTHAARDKDGNMYAPVIKPGESKGDAKYVPIQEMTENVVALPGQDLEKDDEIAVFDENGEMNKVSSKDDIDYVLPHTSSMYSPTTNLVPFMDSAQGNRNVMAAKMQTQALPLVDGDQPNVQTKSWRGDRTMEEEFGRMTVPTAPVDGKVEKVDDEYIYIKPDRNKKSELSTLLQKVAQDDLVKIPRTENFPLMSKTYIDEEVKVSEGDRVNQGDVLADNNFTDDGTLAMGKNLKTAYMPYYGENSNDAIVMSESGANKMTSQHMYTETLEKTDDTVLDKQKHRSEFGTKYARKEYQRLDDNGVIEEGEEIESGELLIAGMHNNKNSHQDDIFGKLNKKLMKPYRDKSITWNHDFKGEVVDVVETPDQVTVSVRTDEPMREGDKISGRFGNKGVVGKIVPDDKMVKDKDGKPLDVLLTSAGVITRINPSQVIETAAGKVAEKKGEPVKVDQYGEEDNVKWAENLLEENGMSEKEKVYDPRSGKEIDDVHVGSQHMFKLFKSTDTNFSARGVGPGYDSNLQPTSGGKEGAKSMGKMEATALMAHDARELLKESAIIRGQKNDEYWKRHQLGLPTKTPNENFAFDKFLHQLKGAGIDVKKEGNKRQLAPMTDKKIDQMADREITEPNMVKTKTGKGPSHVEPEDGGLFDPKATGGLKGEKFSKIELAEPVVNPIFEDSARRLLDMTKPEFRELRNEKGAAHIRKKLNQLDLDQKEKELKQEAKNKSGYDRDNAVKQIKYIQSLKKQDLNPGEAYTLSKVPVTPPQTRPIIPTEEGKTLVSDANYLYRDLMLTNKNIKETPDEVLDEDQKKQNRDTLHNAVGALFGTREPISPQNRGRGTKGHLRKVIGDSPKSGFFQSKLLKKRQDLTGRGTIAPDHNLGVDEIGMPEDMAWKMYEPFVMKKLVKDGYDATEAKKRIEEKHPAAKNALLSETKDRPVMFNRAPTLHRWNMVAAYPKLVDGKTLRINPFVEDGMNADYDGDAIQLHAPVSDKAKEEAKSLTLSNLLFGDKQKDSLMMFPAHEAIIGNYMATNDATGPVREFDSKQDAIRAYKNGEIDMSSRVRINN